jgi:chaperone required for assembly of F1-ATPase
MYKKQAIIESIELKLTLTDPIVAETQCFEVLKQFKEATKSDETKIKLALLKAMKKAQALNQTFIASHYRQALGRMEQ